MQNICQTFSFIQNKSGWLILISEVWKGLIIGVVLGGFAGITGAVIDPWIKKDIGKIPCYYSFGGNFVLFIPGVAMING